MQYPDDLKKGENSLWAEYFRIYDDELVANEKHVQSLEFYKANFDEMNKGA